jgi:hypothetical protein
VRGVSGANNPRSVGQQLPAPGIRGADCDLALWECAVTGGQGPSAYPQLRLPAGNGADALVFDGYAFASGTVLRGGDGGNATTGTCSQGGNGGAGIVLAHASTLLEEMACSFAGGGAGPGCPAGSAGAPDLRGAATLVHLPGFPTAAAATSPHRVGQTTLLTHTGTPASPFLAFAGTAPTLLRTTPLGLFGVRSLGGPTSTNPLYAGSYGAGGQTLLTVQLPPTGTEGAVILLQTAAFVPPAHFANGSPTALFVLASHL